MLTKTCQWTVAHANQTQLSQNPSRVHILHISTGWLRWEIRLRLGHSRLGVIRAHSFLLGQIKPSIDQADAFNSSHSIYPRAVQPLWGLGAVTGAASPRAVFASEQRNGSKRGEIVPGTAREGSVPLACVTLALLLALGGKLTPLMIDNYQTCQRTLWISRSRAGGARKKLIKKKMPKWFPARRKVLLLLERSSAFCFGYFSAVCSSQQQQCYWHLCYTNIDLFNT